MPHLLLVRFPGLQCSPIITPPPPPRQHQNPPNIHPKQSTSQTIQFPRIVQNSAHSIFGCVCTHIDILFSSLFPLRTLLLLSHHLQVQSHPLRDGSQARHYFGALGTPHSNEDLKYGDELSQQRMTTKLQLVAKAKLTNTTSLENATATPLF